MKTKIWILVFVCLMAVCNVVRSQTWVSIDGSVQNTMPTVNVVESSASKYVAEIILHGFYSTSVVKNGVTFCKLDIEKDATLSTVGEPALPIITQLLCIPKGDDCSVSVEELSWKMVGSVKVWPYQKPLLETEAESAFELSNTAYNMDIYNSEVVRKGNVMKWRGINNVSVNICPFKYMPKTGKLYALKKLRLTVNFNTTSSSQVRVQRAKLRSNEFCVFDNAEVLPFLSEDGGNDEQTDSDAYDYLIIVGNNSEIQNSQAMKDFRRWKACKGYKTMLTSTAITGTTCTEIKNYIKQKCNDYGISYVLFVGDDDKIPLYGWSNVYGDVKSDYWYGCLDGDNDIQADVAIGRFSTNSLSEFERMVTKTIKYERDKNNSYSKTLLVAHKQSAPYKYQGCCEEIRNESYNNSITFSTAYGAAANLGGNDATNTDVINAINSGLNIVSYRGHGLWNLWGEEWNMSNESFETQEVAQLRNLAYPVVFSIACLNGDIRNKTCLLESFMRSEYGSVAFLGATEESYTIHNHTYNKFLFRNLLNSNIYNMGWLNISSHIDNFSYYNNSDYPIYNAFCYIVGNDPALEIWTGNQQEFSDVEIVQNSGVTTISTGNISDFNVSVVSDAGDLVEYVHSSGTSATLYNVADEYTIVVNKHNYIPYIYDCNVYIQNETVTAPKSYEANMIKVGSDVTTSKPAGEVNFVKSRGSCNIVLKAGNVELDKGTNVSSGVEFEVIIK